MYPPRARTRKGSAGTPPQNSGSLTRGAVWFDKRLPRAKSGYHPPAHTDPRTRVARVCAPTRASGRARVCLHVPRALAAGVDSLQPIGQSSPHGDAPCAVQGATRRPRRDATRTRPRAGQEVFVSKPQALTLDQVQAMIAAAIAADRAQAGAATPAKPSKRKARAKASPAAKKFASLAGATPTLVGAISNPTFSVVIGDLTFACTRKESGAVIARTTNGAGDERYIVLRPQDASAFTSAPYLVSIARRYGLVK